MIGPDALPQVSQEREISLIFDYTPYDTLVYGDLREGRRFSTFQVRSWNSHRSRLVVFLATWPKFRPRGGVRKPLFEGEEVFHLGHLRYTWHRRCPEGLTEQRKFLIRLPLTVNILTVCDQGLIF